MNLGRYLTHVVGNFFVGKLRAEHRSPRWTTRWEELPRVRAL
jgi:hypothetical protein